MAECFAGLKLVCLGKKHEELEALVSLEAFQQPINDDTELPTSLYNRKCVEVGI